MGQITALALLADILRVHQARHVVICRGLLYACKHLEPALQSIAEHCLVLGTCLTRPVRSQ